MSIDIVRARIRLSILTSALLDLELAQADNRRFSRMVDGKGKQVVSHAMAADVVRRYLADESLRDVLPVEMRDCENRAGALGLLGREVQS